MLIGLVGRSEACGSGDEVSLYYVLNKGDKSIRGIVEVFIEDLEQYRKKDVPRDPLFKQIMVYERLAKPILNLLLYICASNADYVTIKRPKRPTYAKEKSDLQSITLLETRHKNWR